MERDGRFCLVEEEIDGVLVLNQPAGHWERGETLPEACSREAREETAYDFAPTHLVGVYGWHLVRKDVTFLRFAFGGDVTGWDPERVLDKEIRRVLWMTPEEVRASVSRHRSPLVLRCVEDALCGTRHPLALIAHLA
ncbi:MAG: NUDIX hydrolase [Burkholderiales bacterium]|jgi:8-oxo-dGTP pyrophosphatase MutT (NUDIX family)|nr:NUDIX hydrolase [Burkholderiales bacterium]